MDQVKKLISLFDKEHPDAMIIKGIIYGLVFFCKA